MYQNMMLKNKLRNFTVVILPVIGITLIVLMLSLIVFWETKGRNMYFYKDIIVLKDDVIRGTVIKEDMLTTVSIEADKIIENSITDKNRIIGLSAKHFIPKNTQLHPNYFETSELITDSNKFVVKIPNEWIYSIPQSLRRKDKIILYSVNPKDFNNLDRYITQNDNNLNTVNPSEISSIKSIVKNPILKTVVAYVKDSANREVITLKGERLDGSSKINEIEIVCTLDDFKLLEKAAQNGNKFIIMYSEGVELDESNSNE